VNQNLNQNKENINVIPDVGREATLSVVYSTLLFAVLSCFCLYGYIADRSRARVVWLIIPCVLLVALICVIAFVLKLKRIIHRFGEKMSNLEKEYARREPSASPVYITVNCEPNPVSKYEDFTAICLNGSYIGKSDGSAPMVLKSMFSENYITALATNIRFWRLATMRIPEDAGPRVVVTVHSTRNPREMMTLSRQTESSPRRAKRVYVQENPEKRIYRQTGTAPENPRQ